MNEITVDLPVDKLFDPPSYIDENTAFRHSKIMGMDIVYQRVPVENDPACHPTDEKSPNRKKVAELIVMPQYDVSDLHKNPIVQSPESARVEHPSLPQPRYLDYISMSQTFDPTEHTSADTFITALRRLNAYLKYPILRQEFEYSSLDIVCIEERHIAFIPETHRKVNTTLGIRGVVATRDLPIGTPLIYSAQYLTEVQWQQRITEFATYLERKLDLTNEEALHDAKRRLMNYAARPTIFSSQTYYTPAYGAGNITGIINHDSKYHNMRPSYAPLLDIHGKPTVGVWFFHSTRNIKKDEQLLIDYGENYDFKPVASKPIWENTALM